MVWKPLGVAKEVLARHADGLIQRRADGLRVAEDPWAEQRERAAAAGERKARRRLEDDADGAAAAPRVLPAGEEDFDADQIRRALQQEVDPLDDDDGEAAARPSSSGLRVARPGHAAAAAAAVMVVDDDGDEDPSPHVSPSSAAAAAAAAEEILVLGRPSAVAAAAAAPRDHSMMALARHVLPASSQMPDDIADFDAPPPAVEPEDDYRSPTNGSAPAGAASAASSAPPGIRPHGAGNTASAERMRVLPAGAAMPHDQWLVPGSGGKKQHGSGSGKKSKHRHAPRVDEMDDEELAQVAEIGSFSEDVSYSSSAQPSAFSRAALPAPTAYQPSAIHRKPHERFRGLTGAPPGAGSGAASSHPLGSCP